MPEANQMHMVIENHYETGKIDTKRMRQKEGVQSRPSRIDRSEQPDNAANIGKSKPKSKRRERRSTMINNNMDESANEDVKVFVEDLGGPENYVGFFEDDGTTGYLYVADRRRKEIVRHLQIYVNSSDLRISEDDVRVVWSKDGKKCGVSIWGGMRGIIDLERGKEGRVFVENRDTPPIGDSEWLNGFEGLF